MVDGGLLMSNLTTLTLVALGLDAYGSWALIQLRREVSGTWMSWIIGLLLDCSLGGGVELALMPLTGFDAFGQPWPLVAWSLVGMSALALAITATPNGWIAGLSLAMITGLMVIHGLLVATPSIVVGLPRSGWVTPEAVMLAADAGLYGSLIMAFAGAALPAAAPQANFEFAKSLWPTFAALIILNLLVPAGYMYNLTMNTGYAAKSFGADLLVPAGIVYGAGRLFGWW
jgi:hypothetical protein